MSTIDDPSIIRKLIERKGSDGAFSFGRHCAYQIYEYVSGFGSKCYKLIYGLYAQSGDDDETAAAIFKATGNIQPGSTPILIFRHGKLTEDGKKWWLDKFGLTNPPSADIL